MKYEFSLILTETDFNEEAADKLYEAGCDDASILVRNSMTRLQFDREAANLDEALASAIQSVEQAGFAVARVEIERHEIPQIVLRRFLFERRRVADGRVLPATFLPACGDTASDAATTTRLTKPTSRQS